MNAKMKPRIIPAEWVGFSARLRYAVDQRTKETGVSQNDLAEAAGVESGNFSRMLTGKKTNVIAPTVIQLAKALRVNYAWLLTGQEPSGLSPSPTRPHGVDVQVFDGVSPGSAGNNVTDAPSKSELERPKNIVRGTQPKRHKR